MSGSPASQNSSGPPSSSDSLVTVQPHLRPFSLLTPGYHLPRVGPGFHQFNPPPMKLWDEIRSSGVVALDWETNGLPLYSSDFRAVGLGLSWDTGSAYWNLQQWDNWEEEVLDCLLSAANGRLIAHNVYYDGGVIRRIYGSGASWLACTYGLYMQLATESFHGQRWGLKAAQEDLLGWTETNEADLDNWLIDAGHTKNTSKDWKAGYYLREVEGKEGMEERWLKPDKAQMWRAPPDVLGKYCILDAEACYLLYTRILLPVLRQFPDLEEYHREDFLCLVGILIDQHQTGIRIDLPALENHRNSLEVAILSSVSEFRSRPEVADTIHGWEEEKKAGLLVAEPEKFLHRKIGKEPPRLKKNGEESKSWRKWRDRKDSLPEISKNWEKWCDKCLAVSAGDLPEYRFNLNSDQQLRWLLFDQLKFQPEESLRTETGLPSLNEDALGLLGPLGKILIRRNLLQKEHEYVESYISLTTSPSSTIHPSYRAPGTVTGRLAGKDPNIQQIPKSRGTLQCFVPRPGMVWVDCDVNALEQVVLAELSGDPSLMRLYGPGAKANDVYLFVGAQLPGSLGRDIARAGYDYLSPTPAGIAAAKKACKTQRAIAKTVVLASAYGAGAPKIHRTLRLSGIDLTEEEVQDIHGKYWEIFSGVKKYGRRLEAEWRSRGGWVLNGIGRPIGVAEEFRKDIVNRVVQSTGHDLLVKYIRILSGILVEERIPWTPIVIDFHDESLIEVPEEYGEQVREIMEVQAYAELNAELGGIIPLKGSAIIARNLADVKLED